MSENDKAALYVHVPFCESKCRYCGFYSEVLKGQDTGRYIDAVLRELDSYDYEGVFKTVYIGGGSPSVLRRGELFFLIDKLIERCAGRAEFTVEVNPGQVDERFFEGLLERGVNRVSMGGQSFNDELLRFLGRRHSRGDVVKAVGFARAAGFENVSVDLIFAIPGETIGDWRGDLEAVIELGVGHVSAYSLSYEEGTPLKRELDGKVIKRVDEQVDREMYELAIDVLGEAGIVQYEISNFAREGLECKHNLCYWANDDYIGVGAAAGGNWRGSRRVNVADEGEYVERVFAGESAAAECEQVVGVERACETAVLNLRRRCGIDIAEFKRRTGFDALEIFAEVIADNVGKGLLEVSETNILLTREALGVANSVVCDFAGV